MANEIKPYESKEVYLQRMDKINSTISEERVYELMLSLLKSCNHTIKATSEEIKACLSRCDAMEKAAELYRSMVSKKDSRY